MSKSKRIVTRLHPGEAIVVGNVSDFENIVVLFETLATMDVYSAEEKESWLEAAEHFNSWIARSIGYFGDSTDW